MTKPTVSLAGVTFTDADIEAMKNGQVLNTVNGVNAPTVHTPTTTNPIQGAGRDLKPRIRSKEGEVLYQEIVTRPNVDANNSTHAAQMLELAEKKDADAREQRELQAFLEPSRLMAEISYLTRTVKRLEKSVKSLQKDHEQ